MTALTFLSALLTSTAPPLVSLPEWDVLLPELQAELLTPFVYARLRSTPAWRELPGPIRQALADDFQTHSLRTYLMQAELAAIVDDLREVGVPVMLLKGAALGRLVYDSPAERPIGDLDLLIPARQLEPARTVLEKRGYNAAGLYWLTRWQQHYRAELPMVCQAPDRQGMLVELHWSLVMLPYYIETISVDDIWQAAQPAADLPGAFAPDPATLLLHSCAHWALHHSQEERLLWLLDIDRLARWNRLQWDRVLDQATRWRLQLALRRFIQQAEDALGTPIPPAAKHEMACWQPAPVETAMWGLGDERPGRTWRRMRRTWTALTGVQRMRYATWLGLRSVLWPPEQIARERRWHKASD